MKIHSDPNIEAVKQQEQAKAGKKADPKVAFGDLLGKEMAKPLAGQAPAGTAPPIRVDPMLQVGAVSAVSGVQASETAVMEQVEGVLGQWENYAAHLGSPKDGPGLKQAHGVLEDISGEVERIKAAPAFESAPQPLKDIVDELDAMAATEQFKMNRGDYL